MAEEEDSIESNASAVSNTSTETLVETGLALDTLRARTYYNSVLFVAKQLLGDMDKWVYNMEAVYQFSSTDLVEAHSVLVKACTKLSIRLNKQSRPYSPTPYNLDEVYGEDYTDKKGVTKKSKTGQAYTMHKIRDILLQVQNNTDFPYYVPHPNDAAVLYGVTIIEKGLDTCQTLSLIHI